MCPPAFDPEVDVIIAAYRAEQTIRRAVESARSQTVAPRSIWVVDDGSPEPLEPLLQGSGVVCVRQENGGPGAARNRAIRASRAEWIALLDADDRWEPEKLERQLAALQLCGADVACSDAWVERDDRRLWRFSRGRSIPGRLGVTDVVSIGGFCASSFLLRRRIWEACGGFSERREMIAAEDFDLWLRCAARSPICYVDEPLVTYEDRPTSLCKSAGFAGAVESALSQLLERDRSPEMRQHALRARARLARDQAYDQLRRGSFAEARSSAARSIRYQPSSWASWKMLARAVLRRPPTDPREAMRDS
ncbi:MAG: glycosyltransferase family 2 protein [Planctomycetes bacterium]|nr:glycosyltransferase family 2 protein [Planctomycetota bacterium]